MGGRPPRPANVASAPRVRTAAPTGERDLSVIVVNWNTRERLRDCLASVEKHLSRLDHEVIVVDNASSDGSPEMVEREFPRVRLVRNDRNAGFGRANNQAMAIAEGRWFLLLNSDTILVDDSVETLFGRGPARAGPGHRPLPAQPPRRPRATHGLPVSELGVGPGRGPGAVQADAEGQGRRDAPLRLLGLRRGAGRGLGGGGIHASAANGVRRDRRIRRAPLHVRGGHGVVLPDPRSRLARPVLPAGRSPTSTT